MSDGADSAVARGGCRCGRHRLQVGEAPFQVSFCHCSDCRKSTGAPVSVFVGFREDNVVFDDPAPSLHVSSPHVERLFCATCGTPIGYRDRRLAGELYLMLGVFDDPGRFPPERHAFTSEQVPWLQLADDLPRHARFTRERARDGGEPRED